MRNTRYSDQFSGADENYGWAVKFDVTRGTLGITQWKTETDTSSPYIERVLLSRGQVQALARFLGLQKPPSAKAKR